MRFFTLAGSLLLLAAGSAWAADPSELQLQQRLRAHIEFLADDLLRGRQPGSDGYNIAANYVSSQFRQTGLSPAGNDGGYLQQVPLRRALLEPGSAELVFSRGTEALPLVFVDQFYMGPDLVRTSSELAAGLVFAGYGIEAPELGHNDYANVEANGKVVVLFAGQPPRRSILFVAVTGEEKGLVGSEYFAMNPTVPVDSIISEVNLDMPLLLYEFGDVIAFGAEHSSLGDTVRQAAQTFGIELSPDPFPEQNIFVRSDHYRFVQQGIPSVFLVTGMKSLDGSIDTRPIFEGFLQEHYHKPSDDFELPINYKAAAKFTRINAKIGELLANDSDRPAWHEGDFFGRTYAK